VEQIFGGRIDRQSDAHLRTSAKHLGYFAVALSAYSLIGLWSLTFPKAIPHVTVEYFWMSLWTVVPFTAVSLGLFLLTRTQLSSRILLNVGLAYQLVGSLLWATLDIAGSHPGIDIGEGASYIILWVTMFPMVAPVSFGRSFVFNVLASFALFPAWWALRYLGLSELGLDEVVVKTGPIASVAFIAMAPVYFRIKLARDLEHAERMGSYKLVRRLGRGGMGEVWKARHNLLAHNTAVKLIRPEMLVATDRDSRADLVVRRFEREARATVALKSAHTVDLYDFGITANGTCYYVMELLEGVDLENLVEKYGPLPPERVVHILLQVCHSLADAHDHDLIHRDIKPGNIFVCSERAGDFDFVKVLDFGMVALKPEVSAEATRLTSEGMLTGTPAYLPPELITSTQVDSRADLYSLGCVAYWLLTGRLVFEGQTPMAVVLAHAKDTPVPPSQVAELFVPTSLDALVMKCLEKDPAHRPASARDLASELHACVLERTWTPERARHWWESHRPPVE
jgi:serine/threonine-protein kinase